MGFITLYIDCRPSLICGMGNVKYIRRNPPAYAGSEIALENGIGGNFFAHKYLHNHILIMGEIYGIYSFMDFSIIRIMVTYF